MVNIRKSGLLLCRLGGASGRLVLLVPKILSLVCTVASLLW